MRSTCLTLALVAASTLCVAQPDITCKPDGNTREMDRCAEIALKEKDRELNEAYQALLKSLGPESKDNRGDQAKVTKKLREAQRAWVAFRDNDCEAKTTLWAEFTMRGAVYFGCMIERTDQRIKELRSWVVR